MKDSSTSAKAFRALDGSHVAEIEMYSLDTTTPSTSNTIADHRSDAAPPERFKSRSGIIDTHLFGASIVGYLARARYLLDHASFELGEAKANVQAAASAREDIYGPHVAAREEDPVVGFDIQGKGFTTLLSSLHMADMFWTGIGCALARSSTSFDGLRTKTTWTPTTGMSWTVIPCASARSSVSFES